MTDQEYEERNLKGFEGDSFMKKQFSELIEKHKITLLIETGTYLGGTANQLRQMVKNLITIELNLGYFMRAKVNIEDRSNVDMINGDSVLALREIFLDKNNRKKKMFVFLDAHWGNVCPLLDELHEIAVARLKPEVIAIHDFIVPGTDFGYDSYNGEPFDWEFVREKIEAIYGVDGFSYFYNTEAEGARRGILYVEKK